LPGKGPPERNCNVARPHGGVTDDLGGRWMCGTGKKEELEEQPRVSDWERKRNENEV